MKKLTEENFFEKLKDKGYSKTHMNNPFLNQMRSDRTWIVNKKTKQTIGHYRDSHYCGRGDFTIYKTPIDAYVQKEVRTKALVEPLTNTAVKDYKFNPSSLDTIEKYVKAIFDKNNTNVT
jgi:hypothetical protein